MGAYDRYEITRKKADSVNKFFLHFIVFLCINTFLLILNLAVNPSFLWIIFPIAFWGIGLIVHGFLLIRPTAFPVIEMEDEFSNKKTKIVKKKKSVKSSKKTTKKKKQLPAKN
ncbi:MAG: 2TM domain-containing protein [Candidatus Peribacteraceae bacterium]|nr:2TM domain-containing protein [Candidatus Peribacteraceae bacterium]